MEYRGDVKDGFIPHGQGTLTLRDETSYTGKWEDGKCVEHDADLQEKER